MPEPSLPFVGLLVALGCGILIGLERERRKGEGDDRAAAGIRSFTVAALSGAMAQGLGQPGLVLIGALMVLALVAVAYYKSRSRDPGLTTELALFATYLVGVQAVVSPPLGAACGAGLAVLLAARQRLHWFATHWLSSDEWRDALMLAALGLVVLPLLPNTPQAWLGGINLRPLGAMVLLILLLQAAGHVALRIAGPRFGLAASGFVSGFVSSTATVASLGSRARREPESVGVLAAGAVFSSAATWIQVLVITAALSGSAVRLLAPLAAAGLACALTAGIALLVFAGRRSPTAAAEGDKRGPLRLREALIVAALLSVVTLVAAAARQQFGAGGVYATAALAGLADAHSPVASAVALFAAGSLSQRELVWCVLLALSANSAMRVFVAFTAGGVRYGARVAPGLLLALAAAGFAASASA
ncbi:MAG: DUF4010 domain-containing protein [Burkholderiaceae bacterium]